MNMRFEKEYRGENTFPRMKKSGRSSRDGGVGKVGKRASVAQLVSTWSSELDILCKSNVSFNLLHIRVALG